MKINACTGRAWRAVVPAAALAVLLPLCLAAQATTIKSLGNGATEGANPVAPVAIRADGTLFGATNSGGANGYGTLFAINADGSGFTVLRHLDTATGYNPNGGLLIGTDGRLYGAMNSGGPTTRGTIFRLEPDGSNFTVIHALAFSSSEGIHPIAGLSQGPDGTLYGAASMGGPLTWGTVFRLNADGSGFAIVRPFDNGVNGGRPYGTPVFGSDGKLYGTTWTGGAFGSGVVYQMNPDGTGYTLLHTFDGAAGGSQPYAGVLVTSDGVIYGTTNFGGSSGGGVVYKLNTNGTGFTILRHLGAAKPEGNGPFYAVPVIAGGRLYVTAGFNGTSGGSGSVFSMNVDGSGFVVEAGFNGENGGKPLSSVRQGPDGRLYGTTREGGPTNIGTLFRIGAAVSPPVVTSATTASGGYGTAFNYTITATNSPTTYGASPLPTGLNFNAATGSIFGTLPGMPGTYTIGLSATNAGGTGTSTLTLTVVDLVPPVIMAPATITAEATAPAGAVITFTATATDEISGPVSVFAKPPSGSTFGLGISSVALSATDAAGNTAAQSILVNVTDTIAPVITSLTPSNATLWPANHKLVAIKIDANASDAVGLASLKIIGVSSNEPDNGLGDGDTAGDIEVTGPLTLNLRAERGGAGSGRTYSITVEARDAAGHATVKSTAVVVPKSQGGR